MCVIAGCLPAYRSRRFCRGEFPCVWGTFKVLLIQRRHWSLQLAMLLPIARVISITSVTRWLQNPTFDLQERVRKSTLIHETWYSLKAMVFRNVVLNSFFFVTYQHAGSLQRDAHLVRRGVRVHMAWIIWRWFTVPENTCLRDIKCMSVTLKMTASPMVIQLLIFQNAL